MSSLPAAANARSQLLIGVAHVPNSLFGPLQTQRRVALPARPAAQLVVTASSPALTTSETSNAKPDAELRPWLGLLHLTPVSENLGKLVTTVRLSLLCVD